ncbi:hypothetical protein Fmac_024808 [Flemingia macrophylla]|uniref:Uncharacterized protein n=1 Tax=Flemingia macrophylla TaxID=520843 RepID=A0ABD1LQF9_9FABA
MPFLVPKISFCRRYKDYMQCLMHIGNNAYLVLQAKTFTDEVFAQITLASTASLNAIACLVNTDALPLQALVPADQAKAELTDRVKDGLTSQVRFDFSRPVGLFQSSLASS